MNSRKSKAKPKVQTVKFVQHGTYRTMEYRPIPIPAVETPVPDNEDGYVDINMGEWNPPVLINKPNVRNE